MNSILNTRRIFLFILLLGFQNLPLSSATIPVQLNENITHDSIEKSQQLSFKAKLQQLSPRQEKRFKKLMRSPDLKRTANRHAIWGFIFGIAALIFPLLGIPGLILSNDALRMDKVTPGILTPENRKLALLGKIFSYIGIVLLLFAILYLVFIILFLANLNW